MDYSRFIGLFPVQKTLRFELIPQGKTLDHIISKGLITEDEDRADNYQKIKPIIDEYHKAFIDNAMEGFTLDGLGEYYEIYQKPNNSDDLEKISDSLRNQIAQRMQKEMRFKRMFGKEGAFEISTIVDPGACAAFLLG